MRESGSPQRAEATLESRERRVAQYHIRPLDHEESGRFAEAWRRVQARFVDDPRGAVIDADRVIAEVMQAKGYPMNDFDARAADLSVDHGAVVDHYRTAHVIVGVVDIGTGAKSTMAIIAPTSRNAANSSPPNRARVSPWRTVYVVTGPPPYVETWAHRV